MARFSRPSPAMPPGRRPRSGGARRAALAATVCTAVLVPSGGALAAAPPATPGAPPSDPAPESHVTGDAWVRFPGDPQHPWRRFVVDAHGRPFKIVDGKVVLSAGRGTVRFDHYSPDEPGGPSKHHWGEIKVDYVMTAGPVAMVSGLRTGDVPANMRRATITIYQSPLGHRHDRVGFSWGLVEARCTPIGLGAAPFSPVGPGPDGRRLPGYTVRDAPIQVPEGEVLPPDDPPPCSLTSS